MPEKRRAKRTMRLNERRMLARERSWLLLAVLARRKSWWCRTRGRGGSDDGTSFSRFSWYQAARDGREESGFKRAAVVGRRRRQWRRRGKESLQAKQAESLQAARRSSRRPGVGCSAWTCITHCGTAQRFSSSVGAYRFRPLCLGRTIIGGGVRRLSGTFPFVTPRSPQSRPSQPDSQLSSSLVTPPVTVCSPGRQARLCRNRGAAFCSQPETWVPCMIVRRLERRRPSGTDTLDAREKRREPVRSERASERVG